ncbi:hypothetical protein ACJ41O_012331 [Fusarium nematophilum]
MVLILVLVLLFTLYFALILDLIADLWYQLVPGLVFNFLCGPIFNISLDFILTFNAAILFTLVLAIMAFRSLLFIVVIFSSRLFIFIILFNRLGVIWELRSRCGFCGISMDGPNASPRTAYELVTWELSYFIVNYKDEIAMMPSDDEIRLEACRIILASEVSCSRGMGISAESSWSRDLLMASEEISRQAQFAPLRLRAENRLCVLKINGKDNLFRQCPLEQQLNDFLRDRASPDCTDSELQLECCHIVSRIEDASISPSEFIANWLLKLITSSTGCAINGKRLWLDCPALAVRGQQPYDIAANERGHDTSLTTSLKDSQHVMENTLFLHDFNWYRRLTQELTRFVKSTMSSHNPSSHVPTDAEIQHQARWIVFDK